MRKSTSFFQEDTKFNYENARQNPEMYKYKNIYLASAKMEILSKNLLFMSFATKMKIQNIKAQYFWYYKITLNNLETKKALNVKLPGFAIYVKAWRYNTKLILHLHC